MSGWSGLSVGDVLDRAVYIAKDGEVARSLSGVPALTLRTRATGKLLAGPDASRSIEARVLRLGVDNSSAPLGVHDAWNRLLDRPQAFDQEAQRCLAAHLRAMAGPAARSAVLAIPDPLDEAARERLIRLAHDARLEVTLLWRPVAVLLGLGRKMATEELAALAGRRVLLLHLGVAGAWATVLEAQVDVNHRLLTPVRSRDGWRARNWQAGDFAQETANAQAAALGEPGLAVTILNRSDRAWAPLLGITPEEPALFRLGPCWRRLTVAPQVPVDLDDEIGPPLEALLASVQGPIGGAVVEGPLVAAACRLGGNLGELARGLVIRRFRLPAESAVVRDHSLADAALGCAEYARRQELGLPTYFDFLPQIEINAIRERKVEFVPLVQGRQRVPGGEKYEGHVSGFVVPAGAAELVFTLAYQHEETVRSLRTPLPTPPAVEVPVTLYVEQRPAAGFARVEVRTSPVDALGRGTLQLDWTTMERTGETRAEALARLRGELGHAYPECDPVQGHRLWWQIRELSSEIEQFLGVPIGSAAQATDRYAAAAERLRKLFGAGRLPRDQAAGDTNRYAVVDADGRLPVGLGDREARLYHALLDKIAADFGIVLRWADTPDSRRLRRQLYLLGGWCYASAPEPVLRYFRDQLRRDKPDGLAIQPIGRSFHRDDELELLFKAASKVFQQSQENNNWIKAVAQVLVYRPVAETKLDDHNACWRNRRSAGT
jgi:hypothetical protein